MAENKKDKRSGRNAKWSKGFPPKLNSHREGRSKPHIEQKRRRDARNVYRAVSNNMRGDELNRYNADRYDEGVTSRTKSFVDYCGVSMKLLDAKGLPTQIIVPIEVEQIVRRARVAS